MKSLLSIERRSLTILIPCLLIFSVFAPALAQEEPYRLRTLVIDPGHGGTDPGALGRFSKEKDIVLSISLKLGKYIEENLKDVKVIYTRETDVFVELDKRAEIANKNKADLFLSIHANASRDIKAYGTETFAMGLHTNEKNLEVAMLENAVITLEDDYTSRYEGYDPTSVESFIIFNFMQNIHLDQSLDIASYVQDQFRTRAGRSDRGVKQAGFIVLWKTTMPSVLIETGFISNSQEEKYLNTEEGQDYIASAIFRAFRDYKQYMEGRSELARAQYNENKNNHIRFKVQVTASRVQIPLDGPVFSGLEHVEEFISNEMFKYAVGSAAEYESIVEYSKNLKERFPDAFIIAVKANEIIPVRDALKELNK